MKSGRILLFVLLSLFLISACQDQEKKQARQGDYSGVADIIADRNNARRGTFEKSSPEKTDRTGLRKDRDNLTATTKQKSKQKPKEEELNPIILYEENVKIVGSDSGRTLANGVAFINKQGQIVRITISKE